MSLFSTRALRRPPLLVFMAGLMAGLMSTSCLAAPTTDAPDPTEPRPANAATLGKGSIRPSAANDDTRTIDLLVDMQQSTAGLQFNERAPRGSSRDMAARTPQPQPQPQAQPLPSAAARQPLEAPPTPPSGLFGSGATPAVQARTADTLERASPGEGVPARAASRTASEAPPELKRWLQWPREVIEYVRENRSFVAGSAATVLVMGWMATLMFGRRRS